MIVTDASPNEKKVPIGLYIRPASFKHGVGGLCNANEAVALSKHKTSYSVLKAFWIIAFLSLIGLAVYTNLQLPFIGIPNAH